MDNSPRLNQQAAWAVNMAGRLGLPAEEAINKVSKGMVIAEDRLDSRVDSPASLKSICVECICRHLPTVLPSSNEYIGDGLYIPGELGDRLVEVASTFGVLDDRALSVFDTRLTSLRRVRLRNASQLTTRGLNTLRDHRLIELEVNGLTAGCTVNDLLRCLGESTLQSLRHLNVSHSTFVNSAKFCVVTSLQLLRGIQSLNMAHTEFNKHGLEIVASSLPLLENLDISCTKVSDIGPLRKCHQRLRSLTMYNLVNCNHETAISVLVDLPELVHLDVSVDLERIPLRMLEPSQFYVSDLLVHPNCLNRIVSLDVSGKEDVTVDNLGTFLERHPTLRFIGLVQTSVCEEEAFWRSCQQKLGVNYVVSGNGSEAQIIEALKRYPTRPLYFQKSLYHLFSLTKAYTVPKVDVIKLILPGMEAHPRQLSIQMAATACLYNLSKGDMGQKIHPKWLCRIVELTMVAMENFPTHLQLQKNTLLTLCSDRILQEVTFDKYKCARLVMDCLCAFDDPSMNRMCVAICSILAAKISTAETSQLGAPLYMKKLLSIVKDKIDEGTVDITMKFTLSALWNLTDESPDTCSVFLDENGLQLFLAVLEKFPDDSAVETKVLGLVNNIAEVKQLRSYLMIDKFVARLRTLLRSSHIDVSYFAAGIIAHLASDGSNAWRLETIARPSILDELSQVVREWETPEGEMVAYRSFNPFFPLLSCQDSYEVQLWAAWAMQHVCNRNYKRYCPMLIAEGGVGLLHHLYEDVGTNCQVRVICKSILDILEEKGPFYVMKDPDP